MLAISPKPFPFNCSGNCILILLSSDYLDPGFILFNQVITMKICFIVSYPNRFFTIVNIYIVPPSNLISKAEKGIKHILNPCSLFQRRQSQISAIISPSEPAESKNPGVSSTSKYSSKIFSNYSIIHTFPKKLPFFKLALIRLRIHICTLLKTIV